MHGDGFHPRRRRGSRPLPKDQEADHSPLSLFETRNGAIYLCPACRMLELRFGNMLLSLASDELPQLTTALTDAGRGLEEETRDTRDAVLMLKESRSGWLLNWDEIVELHQLVAGAGLILSTSIPGH